MMKTQMTRFLLATASLSLLACGEGSGPGSSNAEDNSTRHKSGDCGFTVVGVYNSAMTTCRMATASFATQRDVTNCTQKLDSFLAKYPGINCRALRNQDNSVNDKPVQITTQSVQEIIDAFEAALN